MFPSSLLVEFGAVVGVQRTFSYRVSSFAGLLLTNLGASDFVCLIVNCFLSFFALRGCFCLISRF